MPGEFSTEAVALHVDIQKDGIALLQGIESAIDGILQFTGCLDHLSGDPKGLAKRREIHVWIPEIGEHILLHLMGTALQPGEGAIVVAAR